MPNVPVAPPEADQGAGGSLAGAWCSAMAHPWDLGGRASESSRPPSDCPRLALCPVGPPCGSPERTSAMGWGRDRVDALPVPLVAPPTANFRPGRAACAIARSSPSPRWSSGTEYRAPPWRAPCSTPSAGQGTSGRAVVTIDIVLAAGLTTLARLGAYAVRLGGLSGTARLRRALSMANDRSRSPNETRLRLIWRVDAGLPEPQCTWPVADLDGRRLGRPDLLSAALAVVGEFDGDDHSRARTRSIDAGKESAYATPVSRCSG